MTDKLHTEISFKKILKCHKLFASRQFEFEEWIQREKKNRITSDFELQKLSININVLYVYKNYVKQTWN